MKILFLGGNLSKSIFDWLILIGEDAIYTEEKINIDFIKKINPDFMISYNYKYKISSDIIKFMNNKIINLHISYLPYNKGTYPNIWSFLENTPRGVTIHYIDEGVDTGDIILQKKVIFDEDKETLKSSYEILHREIQTLFKENWERIKKEQIKPKKQTGGGLNTTKGSSQFLNHSSEKKVGIPQLKNLKKNITVGNLIMKNFINLDDKEKEIVRNWRNNDVIRKWSYSEHIISVEEHNNFMMKLKEDSRNIYWLAKSKDEYKGVIYLARLDFNNRNGYFGIYSNPYLKGVGNLLEECLIKVAFDIACLHTLKLEVIEDNEKALKLYKRFGFEKEGELKDFVFKNGKYKNVIIMGIINKNGNKNS